MENSPLSKLSAELRNNIAEMALYQEGAITVADQVGCEICQEGPKEKQFFRHGVALAYTCKEMRDSYTKMFFSINTFAFEAKCCHCFFNVRRFKRAVGRDNFKVVRSYEMLQTLPSSPVITWDLVWKSLVSSTWLPFSGLRLKIVLPGGQGFREFWIEKEDPLKSICESVQGIQDEIATFSPPTEEQRCLYAELNGTVLLELRYTGGLLACLFKEKAAGEPSLAAREAEIDRIARHWRAMWGV
jgi:hypothetical protein